MARRFRVGSGIKQLIPKTKPPPPEPTMRQERTDQASIFDLFAEHEIGRELKAMSLWLDEHRDLIGLVAEDLRRRGATEIGRQGLPAESVLRCGLLKQHRQLSYQRSWRFILKTPPRSAPSRGCRCRGPRRSRCCTRRSAPSGPRPGKRSIASCLTARVRRKSRPARSSDWTARSTPLVVLSIVEIVGSRFDSW